MNPSDPEKDAAKVIDATARPRPRKPSRQTLKTPPLSPEHAKIIDLYIAARRREQAGKNMADCLKAQVMEIVKTRQQVSRRRAFVALDHTYTYQYSAAVTVLMKMLNETTERERDAGEASPIITATIAFEDVSGHGCIEPTQR